MKVLFVVCLLICVSSAVEITDFVLLRNGTGVNYIDASSDAPQQEISVSFSLDVGETFVSAELILEESTRGSASVDANGEVEYSSPFDADNVLISTDSSSSVSLAFLEPSLLFQGEYTAVVTTNRGEEQRMNKFYGFKRCETGWRFDQHLDVSACSITFSGGCADNGTVFPEPYIADVGLYSEILEDYLDYTEWAKYSLDQDPPKGVFVKGEPMSDGSFTYRFESEIQYEVDSMTPKELKLKANLLHGAEPILETGLADLDEDDERVLDKFVDEGEYTVFNSVGCMDWSLYCANPGLYPQPYLKDNIKLDPNIRCQMEDPIFFQLKEDVCRTDALPLDPTDEDGDGEDEVPKDVLLVLFCDERCDIRWNVPGLPKNKTLECEPGSNTWQEYDLSGIYEVMKGEWFTCDCSNRDTFVETDGGASSIVLSNSALLLLAVKTFL